ncbi:MULTISPECIES: hypothetical protein [Spirulina sp. CCY15215]|nr:hypothetical protein [Spirulina major]
MHPIRQGLKSLFLRGWELGGSAIAVLMEEFSEKKCADVLV